MIKALRRLSAFFFVLGCLLALPGIVGLLFILASALLASLVVDREQADHDAALYPSDLAPESEPR